MLGACPGESVDSPTSVWRHPSGSSPSSAARAFPQQPHRIWSPPALGVAGCPVLRVQGTRPGWVRMGNRRDGISWSSTENTSKTRTFAHHPHPAGAPIQVLALYRYPSPFAQELEKSLSWGCANFGLPTSLPCHEAESRDLRRGSGWGLVAGAQAPAPDGRGMGEEWEAGPPHSWAGRAAQGIKTARAGTQASFGGALRRVSVPEFLGGAEGLLERKDSESRVPTEGSNLGDRQWCSHHVQLLWQLENHPLRKL